MSAKINVFLGIKPRLPDSLLGQGEATIAQNCDFAYGELRNTNDGFLIGNMVNTPRSIYTDDGTTFYTWPNDVNAVRSPLTSDTFNRLYVTDGSNFQVVPRLSAGVQGGPPPSGFKVGVPAPTVAPTLSVPTVADLSTANLSFKFHYEFAGVKYQEGAITMTQITASKSWYFTPPAINTSGTSAAAGTFFAKAVNTFYVSDPTTGGTTSAWVSVPTGSLTVLSASSVMVNGTIYNATQVSDQNGQVHNVESLFTLQTYGVLAAGTTGSSNTATPAGAFPVIEIIANSKADNSQIFDIYSSNSTLNTGSTSWTMAISKDSTDANYTVTLNGGIDQTQAETRAYQYVYVNIYGEMGPPSPPALVTTTPTTAVQVGVTLDNTSGYAPIQAIWIYRTPSGASVAEYFYVAALWVLGSVPPFTYLDSVLGQDLNDPMESTGYYPPPADLKGLMALPNGILCGWRANELWFSEAYRPWAWDPANSKPLPFNIVGGIAHGAGALITTLQQPYLVSGVTPDSMTTTKLNITQAGVSKWSIADVDGMLVYASNEGMVVVNGGQGSLAQSGLFFTRDVWRQRYQAGLSSMCFSVWDGRLVVFSNANAFTPFMIRMDEAAATMTDLPNLNAACSFVSVLTDQFYYGQANGVYQFNGGSALQATWQSRMEVLARPINYGFAQAIVTGTWVITFFADGVQRYQITVTDGTTDFRLPSGFRCTRWQFSIKGAGRFREFRIAATAVDLYKV